MNTTLDRINDLNTHVKERSADFQLKYDALSTEQKKSDEGSILYAKIQELGRIRVATFPALMNKHNEFGQENTFGIVVAPASLTLHNIALDVKYRLEHAFKTLELYNDEISQNVEFYLTGQLEALGPVEKLLSEWGYPKGNNAPEWI